ncbi:MAG: hypothetical protein AAB599_00565 [Patescibacteria group bacterium]
MTRQPRVPQVFKNVIAPVQLWLMSQGRCVGCGRELSEGKVQKRKDGTEKVTCTCGRLFIKEKSGKFRRALLNEV